MRCWMRLWRLHVRLRTLRAGDAFLLWKQPDGGAGAGAWITSRGSSQGTTTRWCCMWDMVRLRCCWRAMPRRQVEDAMLGEEGLESTLLKVGHHGSLTSTSPEFLARVTPQWAVISCGLHNRYGHPRRGDSGGVAERRMCGRFGRTRGVHRALCWMERQ